MKKLLLAAASMFLLSGCYTMVYENDDPGAGKNGVVVEQWHHNSALELHEISPPVNLERLCKGKNWKQVKIEQTFRNFLASIVDNGYPHTITITCGGSSELVVSG